MVNMNLFKTKNKTFIFVCILIIFYWSEIESVYAPFKYAPRDWTELVIQSIVPCVIHLIIIGVMLILKWPNSIFLLVNFLSINASMWACYRVIAFTIAVDRLYVREYKWIYIILLTITDLIEIRYLKRESRIERNTKKIVYNSVITALGTVYFMGLLFIPLYSSVKDTAIWPITYYHYFCRISLTMIIVIIGMITLFHNAKRYVVVLNE